MRPYLVTFNIAQIDQSDLLKHLDTSRQIKNWYLPFAGAVLVVTDWTTVAADLKELIHHRFPALTFVVTPLDPATSNGWMPKLFWDLVKEPLSSGRWDQHPDSLGALLGLNPGAEVKKPDSLLALLQSYKKDKQK